MIVFFSGYGEWDFDNLLEYTYNHSAHGLFKLPNNYKDEMETTGKCKAEFLYELDFECDKA